MGNRGRPKHPDILTPREWEVLALLRENRTNEEIAEALGVTLATARFHVAEIFGKLGVSSRHEAAAWQPDQARAEGRLWSFTPFAVQRRMKWQTIGAPLGVLTIVAALSLVAALAWGASRTRIAPTAFGDQATICTPGPTWTPVPVDYRPTPRTGSADGPGPAMTAGIQTEVAWSRAYFAAGCDIRVLRQVGVGIPDGLYPHTVGEAITKADFIVAGHVNATTFLNDLGSPESPVAETVIAIDEELKGHAMVRVTLRQWARPVPYNGGSVEVDPGDRLLLPGDQVLLIGRHTAGRWGDVSEFPVGKYVISNGIVRAVERNPCNTLDGLPMAEVSRIIAEFVRGGAADRRLTEQCDWSRFDPGYPTVTPTAAG